MTHRELQELDARLLKLQHEHSTLLRQQAFRHTPEALLDDWPVPSYDWSPEERGVALATGPWEAWRNAVLFLILVCILIALIARSSTASLARGGSAGDTATVPWSDDER